MKKSFAAFNRARGISRGFLTLALLSPTFPLHLRAAETIAPPALEFSSGLPGKQVRLTWAAQPGLRYRIEKSTALGTWSQIALVESSNTDGLWLDPEPTTQRAFYRVMQPQAEVFSISFPVLTTVGGELRIVGQCIPEGSFLVLDVDGVARAPVELTSLGGGVWSAIIGGSLPGGAVISVRIVNAAGTTLVSIDQPIAVTNTGMAADGPPSLPPAAPTPDYQSNPVPGIGIIVKQGPKPPKGHRMAPGPDDDCDGPDDDLPEPQALHNPIPGIGIVVKHNPRPPSARPMSGPDEDCDGLADKLDASSLFLSKKGYDYYMAKTDMASAGLHTNPAFQGNNNQGQMPSSPDRGLFSSAPPIGVSPAPSGLPGEVSFRSCDLSLPCPAGPPLAWVCTYRSMVPVSSGHGPGWDFSYNIWIEAASSSAPHVTVHDGGGRSDVFLRQADGSYRCDGMFREGRFVGGAFTLTFADKGVWTFNPLGTSANARKISEITDRNGVELACAYDSAGQLETVTDDFGRHLTVEWGSSPPRVLSVVASDGVSLNFPKIEFRYNTGGKRESVSAPFIPGQAPVAGATTYAYSSSATDPRLNDNLLSITDGAGRLMEAFTYSASAPSDIDFDTCDSHNRNKTGHVTLNRREIRPPGSSPVSAYTVFEVDEIGRLAETDFDRMHRVVACREFTGFCTPGAAVTSTANRPDPKSRLHGTDPAYFETTCAYNADSLCTRITRPDGSQELATYDRDFRQNCPVRERANPRVLTLVTPGPIIESRTVTCDYQPNFGTPELFLPGNPIKGITVKGGRNPSPDASARPGNPIGGLSVKGGKGHGNIVAQARKGWDGSVKGNRKGWDGSVKGNIRKGWDGSVKGNIAKEEGGRHTPFHNKLTSASAVGGIAGGVVAGIVIAAKIVGGEQCDQGGGDDDCDGFVTRIVNAHGQSSTFGYDSNGNRTSYISALPTRGMLYQYDAMGRSTRTTTLNGQGSSFIDDFAYGTDGFLSSATGDSAGLHLTTSFGRDAQGRVTSVTDPRGNSWTCAYNPLDQCIREETPAIAGTPIATKYYYDQGGCLTLCDVEHRAADGSLDLTNPAYSTYFIRDDRACVVQIASEERPVAGHINFTPTDLGIGNFAVCDIARDDAGQVIHLSTPAACRNQTTDLACDFTYTERGQLHRCIEGGLGTAGAVTTEYAYDSLGAGVRCTTLGSADSPQALIAYDGFHRPSSITDPMGNVTEFAYGNDGSVTTSLYGEVNDVVGAAGNVLLSRSNSRFGSGAGSQQNTGILAVRPLFPRLGVGSVPHARFAFFSVETEDDTFTVERFIPGDTTAHATEVTVVDRSPAGLVQSVTCNGDLLLSCNYDTAGRGIRCADGTCSVDATLDACGNVVSSTRTDISGVNGVASKTFTTSNFHDPFGRVTSCTAGSGNVTSIAYDSLSRPVSITEPGRPPLLFDYDGATETADGTAGAPFSVQVSCDIASTGSPVVLSSCLVRAGECRSTTNADGQSTGFIRDALGRAVHCDHADGTHDETAFDSLGRPVSRVYQDGSVANHGFDLNGRLTSTSWPGSPSFAPTSLAYDGLGRVITCGQGMYSSTMTYDSCGNPVSENQNTRLISRTFNHRGRTGITYDGRTFTESRDALGQLLSITNSGGGNVVTMGYAGHRVVRSTQGNGVVTTWTYRGDTDIAQGDFSFDECVRSTVSSPSSVVLSDERVFRDRSQQTTRCETRFAAGADAPYRAKVFTLDGLGRVIACVTERKETTGGQVVPESSVSYVLGAEGHRISQIRNGVAGNYTQSADAPPSDFQMGQYTTWPGGPLEWDDNGNLGAIATPTTRIAFAHNVAGQLVAVNDTSGTTTVPVITFAYDALGRRASRTTFAGGVEASTTFVYDGDECIQELSLDGGSGTTNAAMTFVSSGGIKQCISTRNGTIYYPHGGGASSSADGMIVGDEECDDGNADPGDGFTTLITSATGAPVERFDCDDAGKPVFLTADGVPSSSTSSATGLRWLSPACAWEPEIGMFTCPGSVYSPAMGTVISDQKDKPRKKEYVGHVTLMK